jgi:uncharacterized membrane protein YfcA
MTIVLYVLLGLLVGLVSGAVGIGGGVLLIPALMWLFRFPHREAIGTTLGVLALPVLLLAAWRYYQNNFLNLEAAIWIAVGFAIGCPLAAETVSNLPEQWMPLLRVVFGLMLIYIGIRYAFMSDTEAASTFLAVITVSVSAVLCVVLRAVGRRHRLRKLAEEIDRIQQQEPTEPDYYI